MTGTQLELLMEIAAGRDTFAPGGTSVEEYRAFQPIVLQEIYSDVKRPPRLSVRRRL